MASSDVKPGRLSDGGAQQKARLAAASVGLVSPDLLVPARRPKLPAEPQREIEMTATRPGRDGDEADGVKTYYAGERYIVGASLAHAFVVDLDSAVYRDSEPAYVAPQIPLVSGPPPAKTAAEEEAAPDVVVVESPDERPVIEDKLTGPSFRGKRNRS